MKKKLSIILSIISCAFISVFLASCKSNNTSSINDGNLAEYVEKGVSQYEDLENCEVISGNYVALYNNTDYTDSIYYCCLAKVTIEETVITVSGDVEVTTVASEVVEETIYFAYHINARRPYPDTIDTDGEYKAAYENALAKLEADEPLNGKKGTI